MPRRWPTLTGLPTLPTPALPTSLKTPTGGEQKNTAKRPERKMVAIRRAEERRSRPPQPPGTTGAARPVSVCHYPAKRAETDKYVNEP